jgi:NAD(P)-dependent dehydrogenase (short-subunit alcohol dehydrogenase family)
MIEDLTRTELRRDAILLTDKVALVTGAGTGIGQGIAMGFAEFGAHVAIVDKCGEAAEQSARRLRETGRRALAIEADVADRKAARAAVAATVAEFGRIDILVNNVGGARPTKLLDMTDKQIDRHVDVNLKSVVVLTQAAAKAMIAAGTGGAVINIASIEGLRAAPTWSVYAACKAGMLNFTRTSAVELAEHGVRVNAIAPDFVRTEHMARRSPTVLSPELWEGQARYIPLGRPGDYDDCAGAAVFLASPMANYVTGAVLNVDGGTWASSGWTRDDNGGWRLFPMGSAG